MVILRQHWLFELTALCESLVRGKEMLLNQHHSPAFVSHSGPEDAPQHAPQALRSRLPNLM